MIAAELVTAGVRGRVYLGHGPAEAVRAACLTKLVADVVERKALRLVLESRGHAGDRSDRRVIHNAIHDRWVAHKLVYEHLRPHEDPALAIADAVAWYLGAGSEWRRRIMPIIDMPTPHVGRQ